MRNHITCYGCLKMQISFGPPYMIENICEITILFTMLFSNLIFYRYTPDYIDSIVPLTAIFTLLPFAPLAKASLDLGDAVRGSRDGISWGRRYSYCKDIQDPNEIDSVISTNPEEYWDFDCVFPVGTVLAGMGLIIQCIFMFCSIKLKFLCFCH